MEPFEGPLRPVAIVLLGIAASVAACGGGDSSSPTGLAISVAELEQQSLSLLNNARTAEGLPPLGRSQGAAGVARGHSQAMRDHGFFGHKDPQGRTLADRLQEAGVQHQGAAENLGRVTGAADPPSWIHGQLMASGEHRQHILDPDFTHVGVGIATRGESVWLTQVFLRNP